MLGIAPIDEGQEEKLILESLAAFVGSASKDDEIGDFLLVLHYS